MKKWAWIAMTVVFAVGATTAVGAIVNSVECHDNSARHTQRPTIVVAGCHVKKPMRRIA